MKCKIEIEMDNAAFEDNRGTELADILRRLADKVPMLLRNGGMRLFDSNGNRVGKAEIVEE